MRRHGELTTVGMVVGIALALLVLIIAVTILRSGSRGFLESFTCSEEGTGLHQVRRAQGCENAGFESYLLGLLTKPGMVCCEERDYAGGGGQSGDVAATVSFTDAKTGKALVEGQIITLLESSNDAADGREVALRATATCGKDENGRERTCTLNWIHEVTTASGASAYDIIASPAAGVGNIIPGEPFTQTITFQPKPAYMDQTLTYTFKIYAGNDLNDVVDTYSLRFKVSTPVKVAGLTQQWSKRKEVTAACESPIACSEVLFIVKGTEDTVCDPHDAQGEAATLSTRYCIVKDGELQSDCEDSLSACTEAILDKTEAGYSSAYYAIMAAVRQGIIPENVAYQFATEQGKASAYSCVKSVDNAGGVNTPYRVPVDPTTGRASFTLEHAAFESQSLCVYARDRNDQTRVYAGKGPIPLMLDVTPPTAILDFRPASLQLRFACKDGTSGCKDAFGVAYVNEVGKFLRALVAKDTPQNAAAWCPSYGTAGNYRSETRPIVQYAENEVRVLCLRVEDKAGNAGVAMATVYNAYDLIAQAIAEAIRQSEG